MDLPAGTLEAVGLYLVRTSAMVLFTPIFGEAASFEGYKVALIGVLTLLLYAVIGQPIERAPEPLLYVAWALREGMIGLFLAFILRGVMLATSVAGELIGNEMGFTIAGQADPVTGIATPMIARVHEILAILALFALDAHHLMIDALASTFRAAPVGALTLGQDMPTLLLALFSQMFAAGFTFAAPALVLLFLVSLLLGFLARTVPSLNVMEAGFTLRIAVGLFALFAFAPTLAPSLHRLFVKVQGFIEHAVASVGG